MFIGDLFGSTNITEGASVSYIVTYFNTESGDRGESTVSALTKNDAAEQVKSMLAAKGYNVTVYAVRPEYEVDETVKRDGFTAGWRDEKYFGKGVPTNRKMTDQEKAEHEKMRKFQQKLDDFGLQKDVQEGIFDRFKTPKADPRADELRRELMKQDRQQHPDMDDYSWQIGWHYGDGDQDVKSAYSDSYYNNPTIPWPAEPRSFKLGFDARKKQGVEEDTKSEFYAAAAAKIKKALANPKLDPATRKDYEARLAKFESLNEINYQRVLPGVRSASQELGKRYLKQYNDIIARGGQRLRPTYPSAIGATIAATVIPRGNVTEILGVVQRKDDSRTAFQVAFNQAGAIVEKHLEGLSRPEIEAVYHNLSVANQVLPAGENLLLEPQAEDINESLVLEFAKDSEEKRSQSQPPTGDETAQKDPTLSYHGRNPEVRNLLRQAYKDFPSADNDIEAVFASVGKQRKITDKHFKQVDATVQRQQKVLRSVNQELKDTEEELKKTEKENERQEGDIRKLIKSVGDANRRYDDQERRFRSYTARVAKGEITPQMQAIAQGAQEVERQADIANAQQQQQPQQQVRAGMYDEDIPVVEAGISLVAKHYFTPYGTLPNELINNFGFTKDNRGWYLPQWTTSGRNFDRLYTQARRAFGDPQTMRLNESQAPTVNRGGYNPSGNKNVWLQKVKTIQDLQQDPGLQDPESKQALADRLGDLHKEGINNGWM